MKHCVECGSPLIIKELKNEGMIPYCSSCNEYRFPGFSVAVSIIVMNQSRDRILLIQQYGKKDNILVAGYLNKGETPEQAVVRELREETGLTVETVKYNRSEFFEPSNTLMLNYTCVTESMDLSGLTDEVDFADWYSVSDAVDKIKPNSLAKKFLVSFLDEMK